MPADYDIEIERDTDHDDEPRQPRYYRCADRMCGAQDCPRCQPENFLDGRYIGDDEDEQEDEE